MPDDSFTALKVQIAEFGVELRNVAHDVKGALMEMKNFVSRREMDQVKADLQDKMDARQESDNNRMAAIQESNHARLNTLEGVVRWGGRLIVGMVLAAVVSLAFASMKKVGL